MHSEACSNNMLKNRTDRNPFHKHRLAITALDTQKNRISFGWLNYKDNKRLKRSYEGVGVTKVNMDCYNQMTVFSE